MRADGTSNLTTELAFNAGTYTIASAIGVACTEYRDNIDIWDTYPNPVFADGRDF
jgi:hypothetical protein